MKTKPAHVVRSPDAAGRKACSKRKVAATPARQYPAGFFTALVREHDWPPRFKPAMVNESDLFARRAQYAKLAQRNLEAGLGFASVALGLPGAVPYISRPLNFGSLGKAGAS